jgi:protein O-GlcNAc transferase
MEPSQHLARHRVADLVLDTFHYNAHTTAVDALWAGLPVLTCPGETFASRVGASLLRAIDLPELIAPSRDEYRNLALALAADRERLRAIRQKLERNLRTQPLFDTALFTRHMEAAYLAMHERRLRGLAPQRFEVAA